MKLLPKIITTFIITQSISTAAVTIGTAGVTGFNDSSNAPLGAGVLGVLVVNTGTGDAGSAGFLGTLKLGNITVNSTLDTNGDLLVLGLTESISNPLLGTSQIQAGGPSVDLATTDASLNDQFAVYWFPTLSQSNTTVTLGTTYGFARADGDADPANNWVLSSSNGTISPVGVSNAGSAQFTVTPEPASTALLGLGALGFALRRRRA